MFPDERRKARALQVLEHHMRTWSLEHGVETAEDDRVSEPPQHGGLAAQPLERPDIGDEVGSQHLHHDDREQALVPGEVGLVPVAASRA